MQQIPHPVVVAFLLALLPRSIRRHIHTSVVEADLNTRVWKLTKTPNPSNRAPSDPSLQRLYLIWSTARPSWHHVDVPGLVVVHRQLALHAGPVEDGSFAADGLAPPDAEHGAALEIPTDKQSRAN